MRVFIIVIGLLFTLSCAATYKGPTIVAQQISSPTTASKIVILSSAKRILVAQGFQITHSDDTVGTVSTAPRNYRVTPDIADCGTTMGIDYLKDKRTTTRVAYGIIADDNKIIVKTLIEGEYKPGAVDQNITLTCVSRGQLEQEMISKILSEIK